MAKFIRYSLATLCFAASIGCLAWWWRSQSQRDYIAGGLVLNKALFVVSGGGSIAIRLYDEPNPVAWAFSDAPLDSNATRRISTHSMFMWGDFFYFPYWYPALIFALAGLATLRFRRQFSIRSALITVSVAAALLGIAVGL